MGLPHLSVKEPKREATKGLEISHLLVQRTRVPSTIPVKLREVKSVLSLMAFVGR